MHCTILQCMQCPTISKQKLLVELAKVALMNPLYITLSHMYHVKTKYSRYLQWPRAIQNYLLLLKNTLASSIGLINCSPAVHFISSYTYTYILLILIFMLKSKVGLSSAVLRCTLFALGLIFSAACAVCASKQILIAHYQPFVTITFFSARHKISSAKSRTFWWPMLKHVL